MRSSLPKVLALDLDGTLLTTEGLITARSVEALRRYHEAGGKVVFVVDVLFLGLQLQPAVGVDDRRSPSLLLLLLLARCLGNGHLGIAFPATDRSAIAALDDLRHFEADIRVVVATAHLGFRHRRCQLDGVIHLCHSQGDVTWSSVSRGAAGHFLWADIGGAGAGESGKWAHRSSAPQTPAPK